MLHFKPKYSTDKPENTFEAFENDVLKGSVNLQIDGFNAFVSDAFAEKNDSAIIEGLLRSALNYAANRGAYIALCRQEDIREVLTQIGFKKRGAGYEGEIPDILTGYCSKTI